MNQEADSNRALSSRDEPHDIKRALRLISSRTVDDAGGAEKRASVTPLPGKTLYPAFMVRELQFSDRHSKKILSRMRRRGSYIFHC